MERQLDGTIRPRIQAHGGDVRVVGASPSGEVSVRFVAAWVGCHLRPVTLASIAATLEGQAGVASMTSPKLRVSDAARRRLARMFGGTSGGRRSGGGRMVGISDAAAYVGPVELPADVVEGLGGRGPRRVRRW